MSVCARCAAEPEEDELAPVWPDGDDAEGSPDLWCADCRDRFPHVLAEDDDTADEP